MKQLISRKLTITYIGLTLAIIAILSIVFFRYTYHEVYSEGTSNLNQLCLATMDQIDSRFKALEESAISIAVNYEFLESLEAITLEGKVDEITIGGVSGIANYVCAKRSELRRVSIMNPQGFFYCTGVTGELMTSSMEDYILDIHDIGDTRKFFIRPHLDNWHPERGIEVISLVKPIKNNNGEFLGYIELQENIQYLEKICDNRWNDQTLGTIIVDEDNTVFYTNLEDNKENERLVTEALKLTDSYAPRIKSGDGFVLSISPSNINHFKTVLVLKNNILYKNINSMAIAASIILAIIIISTSLFIYLAARTITRPINTLVDRMNMMELENFNDSLSDIVIKDYETGVLIKTFQRMTGRINESIEKQRVMEKVQTKTLFKALQTTISPHFIHNTLGSIANMCENHENEAAADACYCLSDLLRYASMYTEYEMSVADDVQNLKNFLSVMKSRYRQRLIYHLNIQKEANLYIIPKLTLQPLVENAIKYSLLEQEQVEVNVEIKKEDDNLIIKISDNGCGISHERKAYINQSVTASLENIKEKDVTEPVKFGGMGLIGTLVRLKIYFGPHFHYQMIHNEPSGTIIKLVINIHLYNSLEEKHV